VLLAKIQQKKIVLERGKAMRPKQGGLSKKGNSFSKPETKNSPATINLWRERQLRDYRKANGLCFYRGEKIEPAHVETCEKRNKAQVHPLAPNDLDQTLTEDALNQLDVEDTLAEELLYLSINAINGTETAEFIKIRSLVKNKVMLILMDSGSSHSFVSANFVANAGLPTIPTTPIKVKLPNGQILLSYKMVKHLEWWC
jgi:hypothetical protein